MMTQWQPDVRDKTTTIWWLDDDNKDAAMTLQCDYFVAIFYSLCCCVLTRHKEDEMMMMMIWWLDNDQMSETMMTMKKIRWLRMTRWQWWQRCIDKRTTWWLRRLFFTLSVVMVSMMTRCQRWDNDDKDAMTSIMMRLQCGDFINNDDDKDTMMRLQHDDFVAYFLLSLLCWLDMS